jgi:hypothetical protein
VQANLLWLWIPTTSLSLQNWKIATLCDTF